MIKFIKFTSKTWEEILRILKDDAIYFRKYDENGIMIERIYIKSLNNYLNITDVIAWLDDDDFSVCVFTKLQWKEFVADE